MTYRVTMYGSEDLEMPEVIREPPETGKAVWCTTVIKTCKPNIQRMANSGIYLKQFRKLVSSSIGD